MAKVLPPVMLSQVHVHSTWPRNLQAQQKWNVWHVVQGKTKWLWCKYDGWTQAIGRRGLLSINTIYWMGLSNDSYLHRENIKQNVKVKTTFDSWAAMLIVNSELGSKCNTESDWPSFCRADGSTSFQSLKAISFNSVVFLRDFELSLLLGSFNIC